MSTVDTDLLSRLGLMRETSNTTKSRDTLGQEDFLKLMVTQLTYQDPFQPMENGEFLSQMAQFSTVSGIQEMQKSFQSFAASIHSGQALQAASLVDRVVLVPTDTISLDPEYGQWGSVEVRSPSSEVTVGVYTESGTLVRNISLGPQGVGSSEFLWDGLTNAGTMASPGTYQFRAQAVSGSGAETPEVLLASRVSSVSVDQKNGSLTVHVQGMGEIDFSQVRRIG